MRSNGLALVLVLACQWSVAASAQAPPPKLEPRGRVSVRDHYLMDDDDAHTTHVLTSDLDVSMPRIGGSGVSILVDAQFRKDLSTHPDPDGQQQLYRQKDPASEGGKDYLGRAERGFGPIRGGALGDYVKSAYVEYAGIADLVTVQAGRMLLTDLGQTWVDGLVVKGGNVQGLELGAFGGLSPDPMTYGFTTDRNTFGAFAGWNSPKGIFKVAFNQSSAEGELDRRFLFSSGHASLFDALFLSYSATVDLAGRRLTFADDDWAGENPKYEDLGPMLTLGFANLLWWITPQVSLNLSATTYRNVPFRVTRQGYVPTELDRDVLKKMLETKQEDPASLASYIQRLYLGDGTNYDPYYSVRLSPAYRFADGYYAYVSLDYKTRELDGRDAKFISFGARTDDLLGSGVFAKLEYTARNNFLSDSDEWFLALSRKFFEVLDIGVNGTLIDGKSMATTFGRDLLLRLKEQGDDPSTAGEVSDRRLDQRQTVWLLGASVDVDITTRLYLMLDYEYTHESLVAEDDQGSDELVIHALNARLTWRL